MDIRIVLLPDPKGNELSKNFSKKICKDYPSLFELGNNCVSHVTLIHSQVENENLNKLKDILHSFSRKTKPLCVSFDYNKREAETNNYISIFFEDDKTIVNLRNSLYKELESLVFSVSKFKLPHVTLTRLVNAEDVGKALSLIENFDRVEVRLNSLAICEVSENGTCKNIIASYKLKQ